jgi:predicted O-linked N-acetylglucosamine transferase (SPINDLY family)
MIARQSASLLAAAGHAEWVAADVDAYVRTAIDLANPERLSPLRASLHEALPRTVLGDVAGFTRRLESALRMMIDLGPRARVDGPADPPLVVS